MKKKILLVISALLCFTMFFASCGSCGKKSEEDFNSIVNADWSGMGKDKISVLSTEGKSIAVKGSYCIEANETYLVTEGYYETYVYDIETGTLILTLTDSETENTKLNRTKIVEHYVDLIDENNFAVLTVAYDVVEDYEYMYSYSSNMFDSDDFGAYDLPGVNLEDTLDRQYNVEINMNYTIAVYEGATNTPVENFDWETIKYWTYEEYDDEKFDDMYEKSVCDVYAEDEGEYYTLGFGLIVRGTKVYKVDDNGKETLVKGVHYEQK